MNINALYPFTAVVGQDNVKKALLIALVNPKAGGLLIGGRKGTAKSVLARSTCELIGKRILVDLPLNVTEDMLFGSIDIEYAVSKGQKRFAPGILARANNNILYIDEVNLLRQELLLAILDANASGLNQVERDGISFTHPVNLTVLATMNPEEGVLPQHILDRFGMYVDVQSETDIEQRVKIMQQALAFSKDMGCFRKQYTEATQTLAAKISHAVELLPQMQLSDAMLLLAANMVSQAFCAGHRAELYLLEASKALAALAGRSYVLPKDVEDAAQFVLPHRMRRMPKAQEEQSEENPQDNEESEEDNAEDDTDDDNSQTDDSLPPPSLDNNGEDGAENEEQNENQENNRQESQQNNNQPAPEEQIADIDRNFRLPKMVLDLGKDRNIRRGSGKRSTTRTDLKQGRYVRAEFPKNKVEDLAFDATIRAAAPYQKMRENNGCALNIKPEDLRQKVREKRIGNTFLFAVDASGSMGAKERMRAVKGAIFYMLQEAYQKRDRVGMIAFRRQKAEVLLPITRSVDLAQKCLAELPTGGKTPLADGLATSLMTLAMLNKKDSELEPILILVTDGRANAIEEGGDPVDSALKMAEKIRKAKITSVVIDTETDFIKLGLAKRIASAMGANYYSLQRLSKDNIIRIVRNFDI